MANKLVSSHTDLASILPLPIFYSAEYPESLRPQTITYPPSKLSKCTACLVSMCQQCSRLDVREYLVNAIPGR